MKKLILALIACSLTLPTFAMVEPGQSAPGFTLKSADGKTHSLSDFKGDYVVLEWINYGCPFVKKHYDAGNMQKLQKQYTDKGVVWLAICSSAPGKQGYMEPSEIVAKNADIGAAPTAYLIDADGTVGKAYGAKTTPQMVIIDPQGQVIYHGAIDSIRSANPKDVDKADNYVSQALDEAMNGQPVSTPSSRPYGCSVKYN